MKNFKKVGEFDTKDIAKELEVTNFWNWLNMRKAPGLNHNVVDDIVLRFQRVEGHYTLINYFDGMECVDYFPQGYLRNTMKAVNNQFGLSKIGRVVVAKLRPFSTIAPHIDEGEYTKNHDRFHFVVTTNPNVRFGCGDEEAHMAAGDIWWFDNKTQHYVTNAGNTDRIHIVVDIRK